MTKDEIQEKALHVLISYKFIGTVIVDMGVGKCKLAIDAIKKGKFKTILITSPRKNLKENWNVELAKWLGYEILQYNIFIENIQTCYKWDTWDLIKFDFIIADEIHTQLSPKYNKLFDVATKLSIPILGLTGTPDLTKEKQVLYDKYCPIIFSYLNAAKDGIINKRRYIFYKYELSDTFQVQTGTKSKQWMAGELKTYNYLDKVFKDSAEAIKEIYWLELQERAKAILNSLVTNDNYVLSDSDISFILNYINTNLDIWKKAIQERFNQKLVNQHLYRVLELIKGLDYSVLGTRAIELRNNADIPKTARLLMSKYIYALLQRRQILLSLNSSAQIAINLSNCIHIADSKNKVLVFSERIEQACKISKYIIHGKQDKKLSDSYMNIFNLNKINQIGTCQMLTLGLNLTGANYAIIESYTSSSTQFKQKAGRTNRLDVDDVATVIFIIPIGTQAEVWFEEVKSKLDLSDCNIYEIDNIKAFKLLIT